MENSEVIVRPGRREDVAQVYALICELAAYERAPHEVTLTAETLAHDGFGSNPVYWLWVAEAQGELVGIALCYLRYSTWKGRMFYLEDLVVKEHLRGKGIGKLLFDEAARYARDNAYAGMVWQVLDWNEPALRFYKKYGAVLDGEWINGKLSDDMLKQLPL